MKIKCVNIYIVNKINAVVAELADALVLGTSTNGVEVQVLSSAPITNLFELKIQKSIRRSTFNKDIYWKVLLWFYSIV